MKKIYAEILFVHERLQIACETFSKLFLILLDDGRLIKERNFSSAIKVLYVWKKENTYLDRYLYLKAFNLLANDFLIIALRSDNNYGVEKTFSHT